MTRLCTFRPLVEGETVRCRRCGRVVKTPFPPERVWANCHGVPLGVGDSLQWLFRVSGVEYFVKRRAAAKGIGCGCGARQETANEWLPYPDRLRGFLAYLKLWRSTAP